MTHYKTTEQITETCEYKFQLPKYPKSTTDPTFYEPAATRIANMRKSASSGKSLYDFEYDPNKLEKMSDKEKEKFFMDIHEKTRITPGRKPGLTQEEISQNLHNAESEVMNMTEDKKAEIEAKKKNIQDTKDLLAGLSASNEAENAKE